MALRSVSGRPGSILPMVVISLVALLGFVALAIDVGMLLVARNQAQNAADLAAMTGARNIDGSPSQNLANATSIAKAAAFSNKILNVAVGDDELTLNHGYYWYDQANTVFVPKMEAPSEPDNYNLTEAVVATKRTNNAAFARVLNLTDLNVSTRAVATHRPRDVAVVLDYSGSMNNESDLWNNEGYLGSVNNSPNNNDSIYPRFGHYSDTTAARMVNTSSDARVGKSNVTQSALNIAPLVDDFFQNNRGSGASQGFGASPDSFKDTPGGDNFPKVTQDSGATYAQTVSGFVSNTTFDRNFELHGYSAYRTNLDSTFGRWLTDTTTNPVPLGFEGHTQGPKYYGKSFMMWPPDPRKKGAVTATQVKNWLVELGYSLADVDNTTNPSPNLNQKKVRGIFQVVSGVSGSTNWPWIATSGGDTLLDNYLRSVPFPGAANMGNLVNPTLLTQSDDAYQGVFALHDRARMPNHLDWRCRFFLKPGGSHPTYGGPVDDNTILFDGGGNWKPPISGATTNYIINYAEILEWISATPQTFPSQLRAGRILYYDSIPSDVPASAYNWNNENSDLTAGGGNNNERFWKEYIDYTLGMWRDAYNSHKPPGTPACSYGPDFTWGVVAITTKPTAPSSPWPRWMGYSDNSKRPRHRGWFGPMTMVQFISDTGKNPGTVHDISMLPAKLGVHAALMDIKQNHPNDLVSLIMYNRPRITGEPSEAGAFPRAQYSLSRDYDGMINALYYPPNSGSADVRAWDPNGVQTPRAYGDFTANTTTGYGFLVAYNQMSSSQDLRDAGLGGNGRKGAQRLIILETDGMANQAVTTGFTTSVNAVTQTNNSYYQIGPTDTITAGGSASGMAEDAARKLFAPLTGGSYSPGFALPNKPVIIHVIAFGSVFETTAEGTEPDTAFAFMQSISAIGGTLFPPSRTATSDPNFYKICTGTLDERKSKLKTAFQKIMEDGVAVALVR